MNIKAIMRGIAYVRYMYAMIAVPLAIVGAVAPLINTCGPDVCADS